MLCRLTHFAYNFVTIFALLPVTNL